jgi:hypothetical protein
MDALKTKQGLQTFSRLTNQRFDKMQSVLEQEHKSITQLYESVRLVFDTAFVEFNLVVIALAEVQSFAELYSVA